jgi:predicted Ser/Thr protein kinase
MENFDYTKYFPDYETESIKFSEFLSEFFKEPKKYLHTSSSIITDSVRSFGYDIKIKGGEPVVSYKLFKDRFFDGINAIYGQEFGIEKVLDIIDSSEQEACPRGVVLVGPPSSGKTNIIDMLLQGAQEYSKSQDVKMHSLYFEFEGKDKKKVQLRSSFMHSPLLLIPLVSKTKDGISYPRKEFLQVLKEKHPELKIPVYYKHASLDKFTLDVIESLKAAKGLTAAEVIDKFIRIEEIQFSIAQGKGIANIDNMNKLKADVRPLNIGRDCLAILEQNIPGKFCYQYEGSLVACNRGVLHIHDAFGKACNSESYRPLLMLLGSGKIAIESTQAPLDTTVVMTTNLEEMKSLEKELTASKLLDRIEKVPINYLLDSNAEMDILKRDMTNIESKYDIDPNLHRIASYFSVLTRLFPPTREEFPVNWSDEKIVFYTSLTPEQKLFIYNSQSTDPLKTINTLPPLHPFRSEAVKLGVDLNDPSSFIDKIETRTDVVTLEESGVFSNKELKLIDDEFMRVVRKENYPEEGKYGISVRQLQNVIRDTAASSDGTKITVNQFLAQLEKIVYGEGRNLHYWLRDNYIYNQMMGKETRERYIGSELIEAGLGEYGSYEGAIEIAKALYNEVIKREITIATVDRDPVKIEKDLRKYIQHVLLYRASKNKQFQKKMLEKFTFVDPVTGVKVDKANLKFMESIEKVIASYDSNAEDFRDEMANKFFKLQNSGELRIEEGKSVVSSRNDSFKYCFGLEASKLLSHRRSIEGINIDKLEDSFYLKLNSKDKYEKLGESHPNVVKTTEAVINNMCRNDGYSKEMALETVVYALTEDVIDFEEIII